MNLKDYYFNNRSKVLTTSALLLSFLFGFFVSDLKSPKASSYVNNSSKTEYKQQTSQVKEKKQPKTDPSCPIKGKTTKTTKKYYMPGTLSYSKVKATECFKNEQEAKVAGFSKSK